MWPVGVASGCGRMVNRCRGLPFFSCVVSEVAFESVTFSESVAYLSEVVQYLLKGVAQQVLEEERQARRRHCTTSLK